MWWFFDKNPVAKTRQRAWSGGPKRPRKRGWQGENGRPTMREATLACLNSCNDNAKGPGRASRRGSLRRSFGPFRIVAGMGRVVKKNQVAEWQTISRFTEIRVCAAGGELAENIAGTGRENEETVLHLEHKRVGEWRKREEARCSCAIFALFPIFSCKIKIFPLSLHQTDIFSRDEQIRE